MDLGGVANSTVESKTGSPNIEMKAVAVKPQMKVMGPLFKDLSGKIIKVLNAMDPSEVARQKVSGLIKVEVDGKVLDVPADAVEVIVETLLAGLAVDILRLDKAVVLVRR
jgi:valyl-tRNA synthetase